MNIKLVNMPEGENVLCTNTVIFQEQKHFLEVLIIILHFSQVHHAPTYYNATAHAIPSAWNILPPSTLSI